MSCPWRGDASSGGAVPHRAGPRLKKDTAVRLRQLPSPALGGVSALNMQRENGPWRTCFVRTSSRNSTSRVLVGFFSWGNGQEREGSPLLWLLWGLHVVHHLPLFLSTLDPPIPSARTCAGLGSVSGQRTQTVPSGAGNPGHHVLRPRQLRDV